MRMIDADALIDTMEGHVTTMSVCLTTIEARAKGEMKWTCIADVANAPTINAIPVEWLEAQIKPYTGDVSDIGKTAQNGTIKGIIRKWQKEQEAR